VPTRRLTALTLTLAAAAAVLTPLTLGSAAGAAAGRSTVICVDANAGGATAPEVCLPDPLGP